MITAKEARDIQNRSLYNLNDEQLRMFNEDIEESANNGQGFFGIYSHDCGSYNYNFWFTNARNNTEHWNKIKTMYENAGFNIKYKFINFGDERITISWQ